MRMTKWKRGRTAPTLFADVRRFSQLNNADRAFGTHNGHRLQQREPIELREMNPPSNLTSQHHHLVPKRDVFGLKPALRLEWQDQNGNEAEQHQHCALTLGDSLSQTIRIRFSVHTRPPWVEYAIKVTK